MSTPKLTELLKVAQEAAYLGGRRALSYFRTGIAVETKADSTPVTQADRESEQVIRAFIGSHFPDHSVVGEEMGAHKGTAEVRWIVDPIDGTKSFVAGVPLWGVLIGVEINDTPAVGVLYAPTTDEMVSAAQGQGCHLNGRPCRVSNVSTLSDATLLTSDIRHCQKRSTAYDQLAAQAKVVRTWGDAYGYLLVATGRAEIMLDPEMHPWDCAPMLPILEEAGGHFRDWTGKQTIWGQDAFACNEALFERVADVLKQEKKSI